MPLSSVLGAQSLVRPGVCTSSTRPASPFEGQVIYETDTDLVKSYNGSSWVTIGPFSPKPDEMAIFNETQAQNTGGGTFTSGSWVKRTLNTTQVNNIAGCSISSSVITLPAGTFFASASAPAYNTLRHQVRLQNTSDATTTINGTSEFAGGNTVQNRSLLIGVFTIAASKNFELQHRCSLTSNTEGLGIASNLASTTEMYAQIQIVRIA